jgi:hypothetical protein
VQIITNDDLEEIDKKERDSEEDDYKPVFVETAESLQIIGLNKTNLIN